MSFFLQILKAKMNMKISSHVRGHSDFEKPKQKSRTERLSDFNTKLKN